MAPFLLRGPGEGSVFQGGDKCAFPGLVGLAIGARLDQRELGSCIGITLMGVDPEIIAKHQMAAMALIALLIDMDMVGT